MRKEVEGDYLWNQHDWQTGALAWIHTAMDSLHLPITGEIDQFHSTAWSTVMRIPTGAEAVYFKAVQSSRIFETHVTQILSIRHPEMMPVVLMVHPAEPWMMISDMGDQYRISLRATSDLTPLRKALPVFAEIQMQNIHHTAELISLGVPERPVSRIPQYFDMILSDTAILSASDYALSVQQINRLKSMKPLIADMSTELSAGGVPPSIHHDDLHDANIFLKHGQICFSDWGDCCITHPFFSMLILLRSISDSLKCDEDAPEILDLRDIYLSQWSQYGSMEHLKRQFYLAWRLGMINRAYSWYTDLQDFEEPYRTRYSYTVPGWMSDFLDTMNNTTEPDKS